MSFNPISSAIMLTRTNIYFELKLFVAASTVTKTREK
jgi:hypothetical protein